MANGYKLIRLHFENIIDITVPETFTFKCNFCKPENLQEDEEYRVKGQYDYVGDIELTAEQILKHWYPEHTFFKIKEYISNERGDKITDYIPLSFLKCEYADKEIEATTLTGFSLNLH